MKRALIISLFGLCSFACATDKADNANDANDDNADGQDDGADDTTTFGGSGQPEDDSESGAMDDQGQATGDSGGPGGEDSVFITEPDGGGVNNECDQWVQDCPEGEKCMPWANDGGSSWNATKCSPVDDNPGSIGDECTVEGSGVSGVDDCELGSMCYYVDPETNMGICVGFCYGSADAPLCDPNYACSISNNGVLTLCRAECDPLLQDCVSDSVCLPAAGNDAFVCIVDASGEMGATGDACEFLNSCDGGNFCAAADAVPGCTSSSGCCTEFCDLTEADPDAACSLSAEGAACEAWFVDGEAPPALAHVGACVIPA